MIDEKRFIDLYQRQKESGLSVKEFCSNELIAPATFYRWKKILKAKNRLPDFIPIVLENRITAEPQVQHEGSKAPPVHSDSNTGPIIEIEYPNKTIVRIKKEIHLGHLKALICLND